VQSIPSLHGLPLLLQPTLGSQVSKPSQNRKSLQRKSSGWCTQSFKPSSQLSNVHEMPSSWHPGPPNLHPMTGSQTSRPSHNEPSSQRASLGLLTQAWVASLQTSSVQSTLSLLAQTTGRPLAQVPLWHVSTPSQNSPSSQSLSEVHDLVAPTPITVKSST